MSGKNTFDITERALELTGLEKGSRLLDIGCGEGDDVAWLTKKGMRAEGIDMNLTAVSKAGEKYPGIDVKFGDGEFLDGYTSFTFDGVFMQHVLGLINIPDEALHEAYCVLKRGGKLVIVDDYYRNPDAGQMKAVKIEADRLSRMPRKEGDCETDPVRFVDFRFNGVFYEGPLKRQLEETGYVVKVFEELETDEKGGENGKSGKKSGETGSFLLIAEKPL